MKKVAFFTLGCKVNQYETSAMAQLFQSRGYAMADFNNEADIYIINTCTVTQTGDKKSRQAARRAKRQNPEAVVALVGCFSQASPAEAAKIEGVDIVMGTQNRGGIVEAVEGFLKTKTAVLSVSDPMKSRIFEETPLSESTEHTRAFLKIEDGCDRFCSYCIIPYVRGGVRSRSLEEIEKEATRLGENGFCEIVLTGIHIASFGKDFPNTSLIHAIQAAARAPFVERLRLGSMEPLAVTKEFINEAFQIKKLCPSWHLSLQSASKTVLERMNRRYTKKEYAQAVSLIRSFYPDAGITTDIITGFPGETEEEFAQTLAFCKSIGFAQIHVFPYSIRKGTKAAKMPNQVPADVKTIRTKKMLDLANKLSTTFRSAHLGKQYEVLFEQRNKDGLWEGFTPNYIPVVLPSDKELEGKIVKVTLQRLFQDHVLGKL